MSTIIDSPSQGTIGTSLKPKRYDIEIYQGDTFEVSLEFLDATTAPVDLTGVTVNAKIVADIDGGSPPSQPVTTGSDLPNGVVNLLIADTSGFSGTYRWDVQLVEGTKKRTYVGGKVIVTEDITP